MPTTIQQIPKEIRAHFGSEGTIRVIEELDSKLDLEYTRFFGRLLRRLMTKEMSAHDFIPTISNELSMDEKKAKAIAAEIKERILEPVRRKLYVWGIDISAIETADAFPLKDVLAEEEKKFGFSKERPSSESKPVSISSQENKSNEISDVKIKKVSPEPEKKTKEKEEKSPEISKEKKEEKNKSPFVVFETKKQEQTEEKPKTLPKKLFPSFDFLKRAEEKEKKPLKAEVEAPKEEKKTVHYSESRTPLSDSPFSANTNKEKDDLLNLETFEVEKKEEDN